MASGSGWNLWVWLLGVVLRRYIDFLILLIYPYSSFICTFLQQHPYFFFHFVKIINNITPLHIHVTTTNGIIIIDLGLGEGRSPCHSGDLPLGRSEAGNPVQSTAPKLINHNIIINPNNRGHKSNKNRGMDGGRGLSNFRRRGATQATPTKPLNGFWELNHT